MLNEKTVFVVPTWANRCELISISKLLETLQDKNVRHASVRIVNQMVYMVVMCKGDGDTHGAFIYYTTPIRTWQQATHCIRTSAYSCVCWLCQWRRKRDRFNIRSFDHLHKT